MKRIFLNQIKETEPVASSLSYGNSYEGQTKRARLDCARNFNHTPPVLMQDACEDGGGDCGGDCGSGSGGCRVCGGDVGSGGFCGRCVVGSPYSTTGELSASYLLSHLHRGGGVQLLLEGGRACVVLRGTDRPGDFSFTESDSSSVHGHSCMLMVTDVMSLLRAWTPGLKSGEVSLQWM